MATRAVVFIPFRRSVTPNGSVLVWALRVRLTFERLFFIYLFHRNARHTRVRSMPRTSFGPAGSILTFAIRAAWNESRERVFHSTFGGIRTDLHREYPRNRPIDDSHVCAIVAKKNGRISESCDKNRLKFYSLRPDKENNSFRQNRGRKSATINRLRVAYNIV